MSEPNWKEMYREEKEINEWYVARIEELEARNSDLVTQCDTHARHKMAFKDRIEKLEKALQEIANDADYYGQRATMYKKIAQAALLGAQPAPKIGSEILLSGDFEITQEGRRQENNDVFPGFRGNNDYA